MDGSGQPGPGETGYGQVFGVDHLVVVNQPKRNLVRMVKPGFPDFAVKHCDPVPGLRPIGGAFLFTGQRPVCLD
jgi:hypothetical protein